MVNKILSATASAEGGAPGRVSGIFDKSKRPAGSPSLRSALGAGLLLGLAAALGACGIWNAPAPVPQAAAPKAAPPREAPRKVTRAMVIQAQRMLDQLGFAPGPIDGIEGPKTRAAVRRYRADAGLADGSAGVTARLIDHLESVLVVSGGAAKPGKSGMALPTYDPGTTFVYSDGRVDTVLDVDGDTVRWLRDRTTSYTARVDFAQPWSSWASPNVSGQRYFSGAASGLWPLLPGKQAEFSARTVIRDEAQPGVVRKSEERWSCQVGDRHQVSVVAGVFDAVEVACRRTVGGSAPQLTRIWQYAPSIGHYVRINDVYDAPEMDRHVELVAIRPAGASWPPVARAGLDRALQHALENGGAGEAMEWTSSAVATRVTITPIAHFRRGDGLTCRTFVQIWSAPERERLFPGAACRNNRGKWSIPGLDQNLAKRASPDGGLS